MAVRSVQFVRSVNLLTVRKEVYTVRKLHIIIDTLNISSLRSIALSVVQWHYGPYSSYGP